VNEYMMV